MKPRAYWHIHHKKLWEFATEPIENRIEYIRREKPVGEIPTRLRLLKEITDPRFQPVIDAWAEYERVTAPAWAEYQRVTAQAWAEYKRALAPARAEYERVRAQALAECERVKAQALAEYERVEAQAWAEYLRVLSTVDMDALHKELCPGCPWDGLTIFPGEKP